MQAGNDIDNIHKLDLNKRKKSAIVVNDPVSDTLTRIRNGYNRSDIKYVYVIKTKYIMSILKKLQALKYIGALTEIDMEIKVELVRNFSYFFIRTCSTPGRRISYAYNQIPRKHFGTKGHLLLSTDKGILTDIEARKQQTGGLLVCEVYKCQR